MRGGGLFVSTVGHIALIGWGLISLPSARPFDATDLETLPVELVSIGELTKLQEGKRDAPLLQLPSPADVTAKPVEDPAPPPPPPPEPEPPAQAEPVPQPEPTPPAPPVPEQAAIPEPTPPQPEPEPQPAPAAEAATPPEPKPAEEKPAEAKPEPPKPEPPKPAPVKVPKPKAKPKPPQVASLPNKEKSDFDPDRLQALIDRSKSPGAKPSDRPASLGTSTGSPDTLAMTQSELDALRSQITACYEVPLAPPDLTELRVRLKISLGPDGMLTRPPEVLSSGNTAFALAATDSAVRAVQRCVPYNLPAQKYDSWKEVIVTFDPRTMFGG